VEGSIQAHPGAAVASAGASGARTQGDRIASLFGRLRTQHRAVSAAVIVVSGALWLLPSAAQANTPIFTFGASPSTTKAGGHPDIYTHWTVGSHSTVDQNGSCECSDAKNFIFDSPTGVIGDPHATPQCTEVEFGSSTCPVDAQVGLVAFGTGVVPVFNLEPTPGNAGLIGFTVPIIHVPIYEIINPRTESDYGLKFSILGITLHKFQPTTEIFQRIWGVPADPIHDHLRFPYGQAVCLGGAPPEVQIDFAKLPLGCFDNYTGSVSSNSEAKPFISNPTTCGVPLSASLEVDSYDGGIANASTSWPATTGCDQLSFNPSLYAQPTTSATDSPSGIDVNLQVPQQVSPSVPSPSEIKSATVSLPPGFTINPGAADGKSACTDAEAKFGTEQEAACPEFSKVGTLSIESSALPGPIPGYVYLGQPLPGNRYRIFLTASGFGVNVKLAGTATPNKENGQLVISFNELPQSPFTDFNMHFFGSERGLLATPAQCGTYQVKSAFTPWDALLPAQNSAQTFSLESGPNGTACPGASRPFAPAFKAASLNTAAATHTPFSLELTRPDGNQNLSGLTATTPPGLLATLKGIPYCPEAAIAAAAAPGYSGLAEGAHPSCPAASQIGTATAGAGAGTHPLYVPGKVYLAGPYKGAPLSLAVITPAVSGPYDLGNVVVRAALQVNPSTAQVSAVTDPLPQILEGISLRLRSVTVNLDRNNFTLNPTNCDPFSVNAQVSGDQGAQANLSYPFQVANCAALPFSPTLALKLSGGTRRSANPSLKATLTQGVAGEANAKRVSVALPHSLFLDNAHIQSPCTKPEFAAHKCPAGSVLGFAVAQTPLLEKPLEGPVYLASGYGHKLPDLVAELNGQIHVVLDGRIDTDKQEGLRTTFETIPDAPVSSFTLSLKGGKQGLLQNSSNLCSAKQVAIEKIAGQNGKSANANSVIQTPCGVKGKRKKAKRTNNNPGGSHR